MKNSVANTNSKVELSTFLLEEMAIGGGVERQEKRGQQQLVCSDVIPTECKTSDDDLWTLGFTLGNPVGGDDLFRSASLPAGWSKKESDHAMWSYIVDAKGRTRFSVLYKAAFYDRKAHMSISRRYHVEQDYDARNRNKLAFRIVDAGVEIHRIEVDATEPADHNDRPAVTAYYALNDSIENQADAWLASHKPKHADPLAYWND